MRTFVVEESVSQRSRLAEMVVRTPGTRLLGSSGDVREALRRVEDLQPYLVITGLRPPGLFGPGLLAELRERARDSRLIALVPEDDDETLRLATAAGADHCFRRDERDALARTVAMLAHQRLVHGGPVTAGEPRAAAEAARLEALRSYQLLDTAPEPELDELVAITARLMGTPMALISLLDRDRQWFKARVGLDADATPRDLAFCTHTIAGEDVMVVEDAATDPRFRDNPMVTSDPRIRFYAGAPLVDSEGYALGTLCVVDRTPRTAQPREVELLRLLARQVMARLELRRHLLSLQADGAARTSAPAAAAARFESMIDAIDGIACDVVPGASTLSYTSRGAERLLGHPLSWWRERPGFWRTAVHSDDLPAVERAVAAAWDSGFPQSLEFRMTGSAGDTVWLRGQALKVQEPGTPGFVRLLVVDVTELKLAQARVESLSTRDELTGLPNRRALDELLAQQVAESGRRDEVLAVVLIDIDRFKLVNESLGHRAGDLLIQGLGGRLRACLRESDVVARLSGDEFAVVASGLADPAEAAQVAAKVVEALSAPLETRDERFSVTCSAGVALYPSDGDDAAELLRNADAALYAAKDEGGNGYRFFSREMNARAVARLALERDLRTALEQGQFHLRYQPQLAVDGGQLHGVEALIRWTHPIRGLVGPVEFIPVAEEIGLISPIGNWVLHEACRQLAHWDARGLHVPSLSVNVSGHQFRNGLVPAVDAALAEHGLAPERLVLELTESLLSRDLPQVTQGIRALSARGVRVSIDDFGTGHSALALLKRLPLAELKIDRQFVTDGARSAEAAAIVRAIVAMAHALGLEVTAEGVEDVAQLELLRGLECEHYQGYLCAPPLEPHLLLQRFGHEGTADDAREPA